MVAVLLNGMFSTSRYAHNYTKPMQYVEKWSERHRLTIPKKCTHSSSMWTVSIETSIIR